MLGLFASFDDLLIKANAAFTEGDIKRAAQLCDKAGRKASSVPQIGRYLAQQASIADALGETELAFRAYCQATTALSYAQEEGETLQLTIDEVRNRAKLTDVGDADVIAHAWQVDAKIKLEENDEEGVVTAIQGATSTLAAAYGEDCKQNVAVFAYGAKLCQDGSEELTLLFARAGLELASTLGLQNDDLDALLPDVLNSFGQASGMAMAMEQDPEKAMEIGQAGWNLVRGRPLPSEVIHSVVFFGFNYNEVLRFAGQSEKALALLDEMAGLVPRDDHHNVLRIHIERGWLLSREERDDEAEAEFVQVKPLLAHVPQEHHEQLLERYELWKEETGRAPF